MSGGSGGGEEPTPKTNFLSRFEMLNLKLLKLSSLIAAASITMQELGLSAGIMFAVATVFLYLIYRVLVDIRSELRRR